MEELLEKIVRNTEHESSFQFILSNNKTDFTTRFNPPLKLENEKEYEIALINLETYYLFPNIDSSNNIFVYSSDNGASWEKN